MSFTEIDSPLVRGLGQRDGIAYAASSDDASDPNGFALAKSTDDGLTFQPILRFADMKAISACVKTICAADCETKVNLGIWDESVCTADGPVVDAGSGGATGRDASAADSGTMPMVKGTGLFGCSCGAAGGAGSGHGGAAAVGIAIFLLLLASRGPARRARYLSSLRSARRRSPIDFS
jgi:hypothetical protein